MNVIPHFEQTPRRIPIQSWYASWACFFRRPWPTIESFSQNGHRRMMISSQSSAQRAASCSNGTHVVTKRIVTSHGSRFPLRSAKMLGQEAGLRLLKKTHLKENIASYFLTQSSIIDLGTHRDTGFWPVKAHNSPTTSNMRAFGHSNTRCHSERSEESAVAFVTAPQIQAR